MPWNYSKPFKFLFVFNFIPFQSLYLSDSSWQDSLSRRETEKCIRSEMLLPRVKNRAQQAKVSEKAIPSEGLLLYGLIWGSSNHFLIASLLNRRLSCWHLSICSCLDHLPFPFATALHCCDSLPEQCLDSNLFYVTLWQSIRLKQEGPAPHCSQLGLQELTSMKEAENFRYCNLFSSSAQTDHLPRTVLGYPHCTSLLWQPLWACYLVTY